MSPLSSKAVESNRQKQKLILDLAVARAEIKRLTAENNKLRDDMSGGSFYQEDDIDAMQNEIERLKEKCCQYIERVYDKTVEVNILEIEIERLTKDRELLRSCIRGNNVLREKAQKAMAERDEARSMLAGAFEAAASVAWADRESGLTVNTKIRALTPDDAQAALQSMLADAERDMRQRAADLCDCACMDGIGDKIRAIGDEILALPLKHDDREGGV